MCGINGAYFTDSSKEINRALFEVSLNSLKHRGPDNQSSYISNAIALGHNRLSIIDLDQTSHQPFFSNDNKFAIVFNGEIFNYKSLKKELEHQGLKFRTNSDTEVLLQLLIVHGIEALKKLNGFFAFAFYDFTKHELLIARDRFGEKPVFYYLNEENSEMFFGSELKAVVPFVQNKKHSATALKLLLHLSYIPAPYTIVEGVRKLEPGSYIQISKSRFVHEKWYLLKPQEPKVFQTEIEICKEIESKFQIAVERRMISDVPVAGFLSGGIDSTLVSAFAKKINNSYETFSLGFKENKFLDESNDAQLAANKFGIHHTQIKLSEQEVLENVFHLLQNTDEPFGDSSMIALYSLCKSVKGKYKVILSGDGADEVFAGYNKHFALYKASKTSFSNTLIKRMGGLHKVLPKSRNDKFSNKARQLEKMHAALNHSEFDRYWFLAGFNVKLADKLLSKASNVGNFKEELIKQNSFDGFNKLLKYDVDLVLPNDMLYKVDMSSMMNGLEIRSPFMDHELIEYAFSIPGEVKIKSGIQKYILKTAFKELLGESIIQKRKHGFEVPLQTWLVGPLRSEVEKYLSPVFIQEQEIFNVAEVANVVKKIFTKSPGDSASTVWTLLNFQYSWLKYFHA
jgi:asparagine synthase (glutamine-hydrolysing)